MKHFTYALMTAAIVGLTACGDDGNGPGGEFVCSGLPSARTRKRCLAVGEEWSGGDGRRGELERLCTFPLLFRLRRFPCLSADGPSWGWHAFAFHPGDTRQWRPNAPLVCRTPVTTQSTGVDHT